MDISINTPALLFPAISLIMLAHTNRFLALASVVRSLHGQYEKEGKDQQLHSQIKNLKYRLKLIKHMQAYGVGSFLFCIFSMYFIYIDRAPVAHLMFGLAVLALIISLILSLIEIQHSTKALEVQLSNIEGLEDPSLMEFIRKKFDRDQPKDVGE